MGQKVVQNMNLGNKRKVREEASAIEGSDVVADSIACAGGDDRCYDISGPVGEGQEGNCRQGLGELEPITDEGDRGSTKLLDGRGDELEDQVDEKDGKQHVEPGGTAEVAPEEREEIDQLFLVFAGTVG